MRVLLVTPIEAGSGETVTAVHIAQNLVREGHAILFLASPFARRFIEPHFPADVRELSGDGAANVQAWRAALASFRPTAVVFADYPMLFFRSGVSPLAAEPGWLASLDGVDACLVTLDHFGFAQRPMGLFFGPPHLVNQFQEFPPIPERMHVLLPCPMHEPAWVPGRRGVPFRYWDVPLGISGEARRALRRRYLKSEDELFVCHSVPNWAWQAADALGLPFYRFLPRLLDDYFGRAPRPVTIVSVNSGGLLGAPPRARVRFINTQPLPTDGFEALLFSADLFITENKVSIAMGKAVCGLQPCAALKNRYRLLDLVARAHGTVREVVLAMERARFGAVYPYEVFPSGMSDLLDEIVLYRRNSLTRAFLEAEVFGGDETADALVRILVDPGARAELRARQQAYVDGVKKLPDSVQVLSNIASSRTSVAAANG